jgi:vitamin B12 transporter
VLETSASVHEEVTVTATGLAHAVEQSSAAVTLIPESDLATSVGVADALRQSPGVDVVQTGQAGGVTSLFVRGGNSTANQVLIDGIPQTTWAVPSTSALSPRRGWPGWNSIAAPTPRSTGPMPGASVVNLETPRGSDPKPVLNYSGDAGNFHTYRDEVSLSGSAPKARLLHGVLALRHVECAADGRVPLGDRGSQPRLQPAANTLARFTIRNADSATGLPGAHDFYGISANGKQGDQDIYSGLTLENRLAGLAQPGPLRHRRKREQAKQFTNVGTPITYDFGPVPCSASSTADCFTEYFGNVVTIRGANGYTATGQASFFVPTEDQDSNRDELYYQSDYSFARYLTALFGFRYENERGSYVSFAYPEDENSAHQLRVHAATAGRDQEPPLLLGRRRHGEEPPVRHHRSSAHWLLVCPVRPGRKWFHGTLLRANAATGVQEPTLGIQFASLYTQLQQAGDTADIAKYHVMPAGPQRSRTYDIGIDQNIRGEKLVLKVGYYHNTFNHQLEGVDAGALEQFFGYSPSVAQNTSTSRTSTRLRSAPRVSRPRCKYRPFARLFLRGGYTYLDAVVTQSFSSDAYSNGAYSNNPNLPGIAIGAEGPLIGARPFRRPPHTGFFAVQYEGNKLSAAFKGALASRSDDSTFLDGFDTNLGNSLVLPNRDLDFGYAKLDANLTYALNKRVTAFAELDNLLSQQHIGPIGYPGLLHRSCGADWRD